MRSLDWRTVGDTLVVSFEGLAVTTGLDSSFAGFVDVAFVVAALSLASASWFVYEVDGGAGVVLCCLLLFGLLFCFLGF